MKALFTPFELGALTLDNRIVMAPMSRYFSPGGIPTEQTAAYYARRAAAGVGLILTEATLIPHPAANGYKNVPTLEAGAPLNAWRRVTEAVHAAGGKIGCQLWHVGSIRKLGMEPDPNVPGMAPSAVSHPANDKAPELPAEMTESDLADVREAYALAAQRAAEVGFDCVEIHGAHGYLLDQFLWSVTNQRSDAYGGATLIERARFPLEVTRAVRAALPVHMPLLYRMSQWKMGDYRHQMAETPDALGALTNALADAGVDVFHCSTRRVERPEFEGSPLNLAGWTKQLTGKPTITVGSVGLAQEMLKTNIGVPTEVADYASIEAIDTRVAEGEFDLVAVGRALLADPEWALKLREGRYDEVVPFEQSMIKTLR